MSDLIDRLRYRAAARDDDLATDAADRIEQLEAALRQCRCQPTREILDQSSPPKATPEIGTEILLSGDFEITRE